MTLRRHAIFRSILPLAALFALAPVWGPGIELDCHLAIQKISYMTIIEYNLGLIPLPSRLHIPSLQIWNIHGIINSAALPVFQLIAVVHLSKIIIIY